MVVGIEVGEVEVAVGQYDEYLVFALELAEVASLLVIVDTVDVRIPPYFATSKGAASVALEADACYLVFRQEVAERGAPLDGEEREVVVEEDFLDLGVWLEHYFDDFSFTVGIGGKVVYLAAWGAFGDVVLLVAGETRDIEALDVVVAGLAVAVYGVVDGAGVALLEDGYVDNLGFLLFFFRTLRLADEELVCDFDYLVGAVAIEDDDVVYVGAVGDVFVFLEAGADEAFFAVDVEFFVGFDDCRC